jgi:hypothetical protein
MKITKNLLVLTNSSNQKVYKRINDDLKLIIKILI